MSLNGFTWAWRSGTEKASFQGIAARSASRQANFKAAEGVAIAEAFAPALRLSFLKAKALPVSRPKNARLPARASGLPCSGHPSLSEPAMTSSATPPLPTAPGDEAPAGTPGTGEKVCPACGGSGRQAGGDVCLNCQGSGKVIAGIGGG
ncbi:MAG TPA: hypothetical protein VIN03_18980 [Roseateles sp.]